MSQQEQVRETPEQLVAKLRKLGKKTAEAARQWLATKPYADLTDAVLSLLTKDVGPMVEPAPRTQFLSQRVQLDGDTITGGQGHVKGGWWVSPVGERIRVAVKMPILDPDADATRDTEPAEIRLVRGLRQRTGCPLRNVVEYLDSGHWNDQEYRKGAWAVVMPYADLTLEKVLASGIRLAEREIAHLLQILARVLDCCQAPPRVVIHRDLKPANILLYPLDEFPGLAPSDPAVWRLGDAHYVPVIADFGTARDTVADRPGVTKAAQRAGTPNYMPYEQLVGGTYTHHVDHYALGVIAFRCFTGTFPFDIEGAKPGTRDDAKKDIRDAEVTKLKRQPPPSLRGEVKVGFASIVRQLLRKEPSKRYDTAGALVSDLSAYLEGRPVQASVPSPDLDEEDLKFADPDAWASQQEARYKKWWRRMAYVVGVACLVVAVVAVVAIRYYLKYEDAYVNADDARKSEVVSKTDATINLAANHDRFHEPGETAGLLAHALNGLNGEDPGREKVLRHGLAMARSQLRPLLKIQNVSGNIRGAAVSPDGKTAVVGTVARQVHFFDLDSGDPRRDPATGKAMTYPTGTADDDAIAWLAVSSNGRMLAVATDNGKVHLLDVATGRLSREPIQHSRSARSVAFADGGQSLVVAGRKKGGPPLAIYNVATGKCVRPFDLDHDLYVAAVSPDGRWLAAAGGFPPDHGLAVWDLHQPGAPPRELPQMTRLVTLAFRPGKPAELITGDFNGGVAFWDITKGPRNGPEVRPGAVGAAGRGRSELETRLDGPEIRHRDAVRVVTFSEDGRHLLVGGEDGSAQLYDADSRLPVGQRFAHIDQVRAGAVSVAGGRVLTTDFRGEIRFWNFKPAGEPARLLMHPGPIRAASFDPSGEYVLTGCNGSTAGLGGARVWKWRTDEVVELPHGADVLAARFRPGRQQAATGANDGTTFLWDCRTGKVAQRLPDERLVYSLAFLGTDRLVYGGLGSNIRVLAATPEGDFRPIKPLEHKNYSFIWNLSRAAGGCFFSDGGRRVMVWEPNGDGYKDRSLLELPENPTRKPELRLGAADPAGHLAVATDSDGRAYLLDASPGASSPSRAFGSAPHGTGRVCADFSGANLFATGGSDGTVCLWHHDGRQTAQPRMRHPSPVDVIRFSPDGRWLATGCQDGGVRLWDVHSASWTGVVWYHAGPVTNVEFTPAGDHLLSTGRDAVARVLPLPRPVGGAPQDLLDAVQADTGLLTAPNKDSSTASFVAPRPLNADELRDRLGARQRLPQ